MPSATTEPLPPSFNAYRILALSSPFNTTNTSFQSSASAAAAPPPPTVLSPAVIKAAYRRALLNHHPDKRPQPQQASAGTNKSSLYTVDAITAAYKTLLDPSRRAAHDRALRLSSHNRTTRATGAGGGSAEEDGDDAEEEWRLGLEAVDLDDLAFDEDAGVWWRGCRCGAERGFIVEEEALEEAAGEGVSGGGGAEVLVGCVGCSLWMRVGFAVIEEEEGKK
ncbi:CSL zinc finger-domain-containing protein [Macrophomina phaseolina]|uniref:Diphthamide biosynthesis protein 4 n=1 Tax=Macrophomina phaseolina TaxID=35725 RepID=A0ABQ8GQD0_9PEZI|nr:CSL zinc finger-domain-containing protein [Macrophomina phaseolina]